MVLTKEEKQDTIKKNIYIGSNKLLCFYSSSELAERRANYLNIWEIKISALLLIKKKKTNSLTRRSKEKGKEG